MIALRIANLIAWLLLAIFMGQGAWSSISGRQPRRGDAMRLGYLLTAVLIVGFNVRALLWPNDMTSWQILLVYSIGIAAYLAWLSRTYGRGPHV